MMEMHTPQSLLRVHGIRVEPARTTGSALIKILSRPNAWLAERKRARRIRLTIRELEALDARLLRDIGIEPYQIEEKARQINAHDLASSKRKATR